MDVPTIINSIDALETEDVQPNLPTEIGLNPNLATAATPIHIESLDDDVQPPVKNQKTSNQGTRKRSAAWNCFEIVTLSKPGEVVVQEAQCRYCPQKYPYKGSKKTGTSMLLDHMDKCLGFQAKQKTDQTLLGGKINVEGNRVLAFSKYSQEEWQKSLVKWIIYSEQPFNIVEHPTFCEMIAKANPSLHVPSRVTVARATMRVYIEYKRKLKSFFSKYDGRISLTTDTWTSLQNINYMCVTAHWIDRQFLMQKRIISFSIIQDHSGDAIGDQLLEVINHWGIKKLMCITVDNASTNNCAINWVRTVKKNDADMLLLQGSHMHVRCACHIMNLIVKEGLKFQIQSIDRIRNAIKYVRFSPKREQAFISACDVVGIKFDRKMWLDNNTRWNSTYLMLTKAIPYKKVFDVLVQSDANFRATFGDRNHVLTGADWEVAEACIKVLNTYFDGTKELSGTHYPTVQSYVSWIYLLDDAMTGYEKDNWDDVKLGGIMTMMRRKKEEYWGSSDKINPLLFVALALDPTVKFEEMEDVCTPLFGPEIARRVITRTRKLLEEIYKVYESSSIGNTHHPPRHPDGLVGQYTKSLGHVSSRFSTKNNTPENSINVPNHNGSGSARQRIAEAKKLRGGNFEACIEKLTDIEQFFDREKPCPSENFNLLQYWSINAPRYPVLSRIARDIFAIPASTVASESTFSGAGRVISEYRTRLGIQTVEALICAQNWLNPTEIDLFKALENIQDSEADEELAGIPESDGATSSELEHDQFPDLNGV